MSLERFDVDGRSESADVNAHVRAAGGKGSVVLPVHVESRAAEKQRAEGRGRRATQPFSRCARELS